MRKALLLFGIFSGVLLIALFMQEEPDQLNANEFELVDRQHQLKQTIHITEEHPNLNSDIDLSIYTSSPSEWGEFIDGVKQQFETDKKEIALTFDACGGLHGSELDEELIDFLIINEIPATLFVTKMWIDENMDAFLSLAENPLFQIENHGTDHVPLSVNGESAWGIQGTGSPKEVFHEVVENHHYIHELTGEEPSLFRSGTAFYDDIAVEIVNDLGLEVVNYSVLGDAGGTFNSSQVESALLGAQSGSIALLHMNQPASGTAEGVIKAVPQLQAEGYDFVLLKDTDLQ